MSSIKEIIALTTEFKHTTLQISYHHTKWSL